MSYVLTPAEITFGTSHRHAYRNYHLTDPAAIVNDIGWGPGSFQELCYLRSRSGK